MSKTVGITAIVSGILLMLVPRYVLPACEYAREGGRHMHCSDTARAEMITGELFALIGILTLALKWSKAPTAASLMSVALSVVSFALPDKIGYCLSSTMPCNYGMVPAIRFIAVVTGLVMIGALVGIFGNSRKKGSA